MNNIIKNSNFSIMNIESKYGHFEVLIDNDEIDKINNITWHFHYGKGLDNFYIAGYNKETKRMVRLHRYILNAKEGQIVDHINRNTLDNRKYNLRFVTSSESMKNRSKTAYGHKISNLGIRGLGLYKYKDGYYYYDVHIPDFKRRRFEDLNEAEAYYIECLLGYNTKRRYG